jgi:hypothetical protein
MRIMEIQWGNRGYCNGHEVAMFGLCSLKARRYSNGHLNEHFSCIVLHPGLKPHHCHAKGAKESWGP